MERGAAMTEQSIQKDRKLVEQADKLIPKSQSTIDRAQRAIEENEQLLARLKAEREERLPRGSKG
jgi:hypothetical protein